MKNYISNYHGKITGHKHYAKALHWTKLVSITGSAQIIVQATGLVTGLVIVNLLPPREYAFYTIANAMLSTLIMLADGGISTGVMAQGGRVANDKVKLGTVLVTALKMRRRFAFYTLVVVLPILSYLLLKNGALWWEVLILVLALIPAFLAAQSDSILEIVLKLHQSIKPLQKNQILVNILRFILTYISLLFFPITMVVLLAAGIPRMLGNIKLKKIVTNFVDFNVEADKSIQSDILKVVKKILPGSIYFCISGQMSIWLISLFGSTKSVASVGALGRFSMLLSVFSLMFGILLIPRFARLSDDRKKLFKFFSFAVVLVSVISVVVCLFFYLFSDQVLVLLGDSYSGLNSELLLIIIAACLSMMSGLFFSLSSARGAPTHPSLTIVGNIVLTVAGCFIFDIRELKGVLYYNIFVNSYPVLIHLFNFYFFVYGRKAKVA